MKKIKLIALIGAAAVLSLATSCKKECPAKPTQTCSYNNKDLKTIIKLANPALYHKMYEQKDIISSDILIIKGFNDGYGNCEDKDCICTVIVTTVYSALGVSDSLNITSSSPNVNVSFPNPGDATLILAKPDAPVSVDPQSVQVTTAADGTTKRVDYVPY